MAQEDYASGVQFQISVYADRSLIWNNSRPPEDWTVERLTSTHPSELYNPDIANASVRGGWVKAWGLGIEKVDRHITSPIR